MPKKLTQEEWIARAKAIHGDKYDYSKVKYVNSVTKVTIICPVHGEFKQIAVDHINGHGCSKCKLESTQRKRNLDAKNSFIEKARKAHGDKYDYSKVNYINATTPVSIICPVHGEFKITPNKHLNGRGCKLCSREKQSDRQRLTKEEFIEKARKVHGDKYDYSKVEYKGNKVKVCIICPEHGKFWQIPNTHLLGGGCKECAKDVIKIKERDTLEEFIEKARKIHGDKYDYSKVEYVNSQTKVCIICPEHGEFLMRPNCHLNGQNCHKCNRRNQTEMKIYSIIKEHFPDAIYHYRNTNIIENLEIDIFIPSKRCAIEVDGSQHFKPNSFFGGYKQFLKQCENDVRKFELCKKNNIPIFYYTNLKHYPSNYLDKIYRNIDDIIIKINEL